VTANCKVQVHVTVVMPSSLVFNPLQISVRKAI